MKIISIRYSRDADSLLERMGRKMGVLLVGGGGQMLWEASVLEDLYGMKAEPDLTKTQNS